MYLIQILLPLYDNAGHRFDAEAYAAVRAELTERYGGLTAYSRAPAEGLWESKGDVKRDDIIVFEVMTAELDEAWWTQYRKALEARFRQDAIVVRAQTCKLL
jgi:hypothetical protein